MTHHPDGMPDNAGEIPPTPLFFLHIRKTGGVSLRNLLMQRFAIPDTLLDWHHRQNFDQDPGQFRFITGHRSFTAIRRFAIRPHVLVFLRDPLERALSAYSFYRDNTPEFLRGLQATLATSQYEQRERFTRLASQMSITQFLRSEEELARGWLSNVQTRVLGGAVDGEPVPLPDEQLFAEASGNLIACSVVGLVEQMAASLEILCRYQGWQPFDSPRHDHRTPGRLDKHDVPSSAIEILTDWNRLDSELYAQATQLFDLQDRGSTGVATASHRHASDLPSAWDYGFDQPIMGKGWHLRERYQDRWICWTGADAEATLELRHNSGGVNQLECQVEQVLSRRVFDGLQILVNDTAVHWRRIRRARKVWLTALVPPQAMKPGDQSVRIRFVVRDRLRPCDLSARSADSRRLGIAFGRVRLRPLNEFTSQ